MECITDTAIRRRGEDKEIMNCIMCLADGDETEAAFYVNVGDGDVEAGYCVECAESMTRQGFKAIPINRRGGNYKTEQRAEAAALLRNGSSLREAAEKSGLSKGTVESVRKEIVATLPLECACGEPLGHKGWCKSRLEKSPARQEVMARLHEPFGSSLSPVVQGKRATYRISDEARTAIIAEPPDIRASVLAKQYGCSPASIDNIRRAAGVVPQPHRRGPMNERKEELRVTTPVTIVTVPEKVQPPDMTLSRAFELVIAEMEGNIDCLREQEDDPDIAEGIKHDEDVVGTLRGWHPAFMGFSSSAPRVSIYERALQRAESELRLINLEIGRLQMRKGALTPMVDALKLNINAERESR